MTVTNKDAKEFEKMLEKMKPMTIEEEYRNADVPMPKGPNDLEATIERLEFRNAKLHNYNEKIEQEIIELRRDNKKLSKQCEDLLHQFRNKGVL
tara:strand:+ start:193 stop:474 length:282 start_codon:yes stop_codon:yes gene_type:complete